MKYAAPLPSLELTPKIPAWLDFAAKMLTSTRIPSLYSYRSARNRSSNRTAEDWPVNWAAYSSAFLLNSS
jgi:hypothetical protein